MPNIENSTMEKWLSKEIQTRLRVSKDEADFATQDIAENYLHHVIDFDKLDSTIAINFQNETSSQNVEEPLLIPPTTRVAIAVQLDGPEAWIAKEARVRFQVNPEQAASIACDITDNHLSEIVDFKKLDKYANISLDTPQKEQPTKNMIKQQSLDKIKQEAFNKPSRIKDRKAESSFQQEAR